VTVKINVRGKRHLPGDTK